MSEPTFVSADGDFWINVDHITYVRPFLKVTNGEGNLITEIGVVGMPAPVYADTPPRDFLNRMTGLVWK